MILLICSKLKSNMEQKDLEMRVRLLKICIGEWNNASRDMRIVCLS